MIEGKTKKPIYKRWWFWVILIFVLAGIGTALDGGDEEATTEPETEVVSPEDEENEVNTEEEQVVAEEAEEEAEEEPQEEEVVELSPREEMINKILVLIDQGKAFDAGSYTQGDIPKGEYAFIPYEGSGQYYSEEDLNRNILDNEIFDSFGYVYVHDAGNIQTDAVLISVDAFEELGVTGAKEIFEIVNGHENYMDSGWYKVGIDIPAGKYVIESYGEGYVAVMSGPVGNSEIVDNEIFNGRYTVNVSDGQYLQISRGKIAE